MKRSAFDRTARQLAAIGKRFYARGWALGTSGNFSAVVERKPLRLAMTASSVAKGSLTRTGKPSAETLLHVEVVRRRGAGAVLHTHSVWSTMLSESWAGTTDGALVIEGYEMLKGLAGVASHEHREVVPILENDQDIPRLAVRVGETLDRHPDAHAFLLRRHGLYTWGETLAEAERHVEILEFLFEVVGRNSLHRGAADPSRMQGGLAWRS
jgi:methylthioribulose-1-phosphate dehydratase